MPSPGTFAAIGIMGQYIYVDPRRETVISTIMVLAFAVLTMAFFFSADMIMSFAVGTILGLGR